MPVVALAARSGPHVQRERPLMSQSHPERRSLLTQRLQDETLVCTADDGVCALNETACQLLELCDGARTHDEIAAELARAYPDEDQRRVVADALQALSDLEAYGLTD